MNEELKKKLINDIYKTGFVSELSASSELVKNNWRVENNRSYLDKDQDKNREIDIVGYKGTYYKDVNLRVGIHLVCEVKKTNKPWIIFSSVPNDYKKDNFPGWTIINSHYNLTNKQLSYKDFKSNYMRLPFTRIGSAYHEAFKNPNEPSKIFESIMSACKAAVWLKELNSSFEIDKYDPEQEHSMDIFLPIIILDGDLVESYLNIDGAMELESKEYIPIKFTYSSPKYNESRFYPDIVTIKGLSSYINSVVVWYESICEKIVYTITRELNK